MINKYNRVAKEQKDLEYKIKNKLRTLEDGTGQTIVTYFFAGSLTVAGTYFSSHYTYDGTWSTSPLCTSNDTPDTLESAVKNAGEMFKAKKEWEDTLVKIDEMLKEQ